MEYLHLSGVTHPITQERLLEIATNEKIVNLINRIRPIGKSDNIFARKEYDTFMYCVDFSDFVRDLIIENDLCTLCAFLEILTMESYETKSKSSYHFYSILSKKAISVVLDHGFPIEEHELYIAYANNDREFTEKVDPLLKKHFAIYEYEKLISYLTSAAISKKEALKHLLTNDIQKYIITEKQARDEIKSIFILYGGLAPFEKERGYWIYGKSMPVLFYALSIYNFSTTEFINQLIERRNFFIKWSNEDLNYDIEQPMLTIEDIGNIDQLEVETDIIEKLKRLSIIERLYFLKSYAESNNCTYWNVEAVSYEIKSYGVNELQIKAKLIELDLFEYSKDTESILYLYDKSQLKEKAESAGFQLKKSWTKQKIYEYLKSTESGTMFIENEVEEKKMIKLREKYIADTTSILRYKQRIKNIIQLICFI